MQKDVLYGLQQGTQVLQTIHKEMGGIEGVERLMGESEEARAYQEVSCQWGDLGVWIGLAGGYFANGFHRR